MFGRSAVLEKSQIDECLETKKTIGDYRYGVRAFDCEVAGWEHYSDQYQEIAMRTRKGITSSCEVVQEPNNSHDKRAIAILVEGKIAGYVPKECLDYMHKVFEAMGDESIRLVGTITTQPAFHGGLTLIAKIRVCRFSK